LARYRPHGSLEFLGRIDRQVKIRGFRVELGEIEAVLARHPSVQECAVVAREVAHGDTRLVAYVVPTDHRPPTTDHPPPTTDDDLPITLSPCHLVTLSEYSSLVTELRAYLRERLPGYMLPGVFVVLEALPLTPSGKIDRRALAHAELPSPLGETRYVAPQTELERMIAAIWHDVLRVEQAGTHDNFFDLGGHSLLLVQVQSRLQDLLGRDLSLVTLFQHPTIGSLAHYLRREQDEQPALEPTYARAAARRDSLRQRSRLRQARRTAGQQEESEDE
jgi:aryl carrier-like protein